MLEKDIENRLVQAVEKAGGQALKFEVPGKAGMPDRIILVPGGRVIFVEVKAPGGKPRMLQRKRLDDLTALGFEATYIDSIREAEEIAEVVKWQATSFHTTTKNIQ